MPRHVGRWELTPEQGELAASCYGLAMQLAKPYKARWPRHADDFESAALLGLCRAAFKFDKSRGFAFSTFAGKYVEGYLKSQATKPTRRQAGFEAGLGSIPEGHEALDDGGDPGEDLDGDPYQRTVELAALGDRERRILDEYYRDGRTLEAIGDDLGVTKERVRQIKLRSLRKLRESAA